MRPRVLTSLSKRLWRLRRNPVVVRRRGALFLLHPRNWIDNRLLAGAPFEDQQIRLARQCIQDRGIDLVIDAGANIGLYSVLLGLLPAVKNGIAFEPVRRNHAQLMSNLFLNGLTQKVEARCLGLAAQPLKTMIHIDPGSTGVSRLDLDTTDRQKSAFKETEMIDLVRFDDVCTFQNRKVFLKIDVEGGAAGVLQGMQRFLKLNDVVIQVELSAGERENAERLLTDLSFKKIRQIEDDSIFSRS